MKRYVIAVLVRGSLKTKSPKNFSPDVKEKASIYVPAIGKVTIVVLLRNLLVCSERCIESTRETDELLAHRSESQGNLAEACSSCKHTWRGCINRLHCLENDDFGVCKD